MQRPPWAPGGPSGGRLGCQEARPEAVLGARRPVRRPSWALGGPSEGRLGRQEARREAVLDARRPVGRSSWAPGGPSGGRFGRQEVRREAVLAARSPESSVLPTVAAKMQVLRGLQAGRRLQAGGSAHQVPKPPRDNRRIFIRYWFSLLLMKF